MKEKGVAKALRKTVKKFKTNARERSTIAAYTDYARIFNSLFDVEGWSAEQSHIPPEELLTNDYLEMFLAKVFSERSKSGVVQARKWINHPHHYNADCLTHYGKPPLNKYSRQLYASVLDTLSGLMKTEEWRDYMTGGAEPIGREHRASRIPAPPEDPQSLVSQRALRKQSRLSRG